MAVSDWDKAVADAKKILGNSAKIPTARLQAADKKTEDALKSWQKFQATREILKKQLLEMQDEFSKVKNALVQAEDEIDDEDFGLDEKKPDDKKKIDQALAIFKKYFAGTEKTMDDNNKKLDGLDKHLVNLAKYKSSS